MCEGDGIYMAVASRVSVRWEVCVRQSYPLASCSSVKIAVLLVATSGIFSMYPCGCVEPCLFGGPTIVVFTSSCE